MNAFDFVPLEKALDVSNVNEVALALGVNRRHVMHWRSVGLTAEEAVELAEKAGLEAVELWPALADGKLPAAVEPREVGEAPPASVDGDAIVWCDPPGRLGTVAGSAWPSRLAPLVERPGDWARIHVADSKKKAHHVATWLRKLDREGRLAAGRWQFSVRDLEGGKGGIWARYLAPEAGER